MRTICVIEDYDDVRENIVEILELAGYNVISAPNGKVGLSLVLEHIPDLIICDVMMPELDGFGVLKILSGNSKTHQIPFIFLTAKTEKNDFRKGMSLGADDYLTKPFDDIELLEAIEIRLKKSDIEIAAATSENKQSLSLFNPNILIEGLAKLAMESEQRLFKRKDVVYDAGQNPRYIYYVESGKVKSFLYNDHGKELITNIYTNGEVFGHLCIITDTNHSDNTAAMEDSILRMIPVQKFKEFLNDNVQFNKYFLTEMVKNNLETKKQMLDFAYSSVRRKLALALLTIFRKNNQQSKIQILREDLAAISGMAKETVIRTLSDFKSEGLLDIEDHHIILLDIKKLENMNQ